ncbi:MAG TPA: hypothetical protein DEQ02_07080 [Ruminococcaceae bacterium]|nr:hypothetical protein [Oscillospiraceae bacterium]
MEYSAVNPAFDHALGGPFNASSHTGISAPPALFDAVSRFYLRLDGLDGYPIRFGKSIIHIFQFVNNYILNCPRLKTLGTVFLIPCPAHMGRSAQEWVIIYYPPEVLCDIPSFNSIFLLDESNIHNKNSFIHVKFSSEVYNYNVFCALGLVFYCLT